MKFQSLKLYILQGENSHEKNGNSKSSEKVPESRNFSMKFKRECLPNPKLFKPKGNAIFNSLISFPFPLGSKCKVQLLVYPQLANTKAV